MAQRFLSIRNLEKYQTNRKENPPWFKIHRVMFGDPAFIKLTPSQRFLYIGLIHLAVESGNKIYNDSTFIGQRLYIKSTEVDLKPLYRAGFLYTTNLSRVLSERETEESRDRGETETEEVDDGLVEYGGSASLSPGVQETKEGIRTNEQKPRSNSERQSQSSQIQREESREIALDGVEVEKVQSHKAQGALSQLQTQSGIRINATAILADGERSEQSVRHLQHSWRSSPSQETSDRPQSCHEQGQGIVVPQLQSDLRECKGQRGISKEGNKLSSVLQREFDLFWEKFPRKVGKKEALKSWMKASDKPPIEDILQSIERAKQSTQWTKENGQFIPHPATWLNRGQWADVPPENKPSVFEEFLARGEGLDEIEG